MRLGRLDAVRCFAQCSRTASAVSALSFFTTKSATALSLGSLQYLRPGPDAEI